MSTTFRQNVLFFILVVLTLNIAAQTTLGWLFMRSNQKVDPSYDIIDCGDGTGRVHKCIRVDPKAGEVSNAATGASYRVIFGH
jgi:hypothetical protein